MEKKFAKTIDSILSEKGCPKINLQIRGSNEQTRCSKKHLDTSRKTVLVLRSVSILQAGRFHLGPIHGISGKVKPAVQFARTTSCSRSSSAYSVNGQTGPCHFVSGPTTDWWHQAFTLCQPRAKTPLACRALAAHSIRETPTQL